MYPIGPSKARSQDEVTQWVQEHVFTVPEFYYGSGDPHTLITTSSRKPVNVTLSIPGVGFKIYKTITKDSSIWDIDLSPTDGHDIHTLRGIGKQNTTVIVRSSDTVNVHAISHDIGGGDGFVVIPTNQLGTTHYVASYQTSDWKDPAFVCITALHMNTLIYIQTNRKHIRETLQQYESYRFDGDKYEDLTGALVQSDKPIAVISGVRASVSSGRKDGLLVQIPPTNMWGETFSIVPFSLNLGYVYRVQTLNKSTTLKFSDDKVVEIKPEIHGVKTFYEADVIGYEMISFTSDQPVMVIQYLKSANNPLRGGPAMLIVPPFTLFGHNVTFPVFQFYYVFEHFITVIAECTAMDDGFQLDDAPVDWYQTQPIDETMCYANHNVTIGQHSLTHANPMASFYVSVYGICRKCYSSYAYLANCYCSQGEYYFIHTPINDYCSTCIRNCHTYSNRKTSHYFVNYS